MVPRSPATSLAACLIWLKPIVVNAPSAERITPLPVTANHNLAIDLILEGPVVQRFPASFLVRAIAIWSLIVGGLARPAELVKMDDQILVTLPAFKCFVEKAIPAPERGPSSYTHSYIGKVWLKAEPAQVLDPLKRQPVSLGQITMFRAEGVYEELLTYHNASWAWYDDEAPADKLQGFGDRARANEDAYDGIPPFFFSLSRITRSGLLHGRNGRPAYFLSECTFSEELRNLSASQKAAVEAARARQVQPNADSAAY